MFIENVRIEACTRTQKGVRMKPAKEHFWFKLESKNWLLHNGLRSVSLAARGLWIDMLALMHQTTHEDDRGYLLVRESGIARPYPTHKLAQWVGIDEVECKYLLDELERFDVYHYDERGIIYCAWMVDGEKLKRRKAVGGKLGGNPALLKKAEPMQVSLGFEAEEEESAQGLQLTLETPSKPMVNHKIAQEKNMSVYGQDNLTIPASAIKGRVGSTDSLLSEEDATVVQTKNGHSFELPEARLLDPIGAVVTRRLTPQEFYALEHNYYDLDVPKEVADYAYWTKGQSPSRLHKNLYLGVQGWLKKARGQADAAEKETRALMDRRAEWPRQFRDLWEIYPRPEGVVSALRKWHELYPTGHTSEFDAIRAGLKVWIAAPQWSNPRYVPMFAKFMDERRWAETPAPVHAEERGDRPAAVTKASAPQPKVSDLPREPLIGGGETTQSIVRGLFSSNNRRRVSFAT